MLKLLVSMRVQAYDWSLVVIASIMTPNIIFSKAVANSICFPVN